MKQKPRRLATFVRVDGRRWGPEDDIPPEVAEKITNPKAWAAPEDDDELPQAPARKTGTRSGHRLASYVHVGGHRYGPDDPIPDGVARQITNPKAWKGGKVPPKTREGGLVQAAAGAAANLSGQPEAVLTGKQRDQVPWDGRAAGSAPTETGDPAAPPAPATGDDTATSDDTETGDAETSPPPPADGDVAELEPERVARVPAPPRTGRGSGLEAWATFANTQGVQFEPGSTRDEIIAACERAEVIAPAEQ